MSIEIIGIVGSGQMGAGIAQVAAQAGMEVLLSDISMESANKGKAKVEKSLNRLAEKGKIESAKVQETLQKIKCLDSLNDLNSADYIIEAAIEQQELKFKIFQQLDEIAKPGALLASNTSSISITKIAAQTKRPQDVVGMHFMNPVPIMKLVEGIRGLRTSDESFQKIS